MFSNLFRVLSRGVKPTETFGLNVWAYGLRGAWVLSAPNLLTYYLTSGGVLRQRVVSVLQLYPAAQYVYVGGAVFASLLAVGLG